MSIDEKAFEAIRDFAIERLISARNLRDILNNYETAKVAEQPITGRCALKSPQGEPPANSQPDELPERDNTKPAEQQGIFRKFEVHRTDGSSEPGGKHHGCEYFVLDVEHDQYAKTALSSYAWSCRKTHPELANDMLIRYKLELPDIETLEQKSYMRGWREAQEHHIKREAKPDELTPETVTRVAIALYQYKEKGAIASGITWDDIHENHQGDYIAEARVAIAAMPGMLWQGWDAASPSKRADEYAFLFEQPPSCTCPCHLTHEVCDNECCQADELPQVEEIKPCPYVNGFSSDNSDVSFIRRSYEHYSDFVIFENNKPSRCFRFAKAPARGSEPADLTHQHLEELATEIRKAAYPNRKFSHYESFLCARAAHKYLSRYFGDPVREYSDRDVETTLKIANAAIKRNGVMKDALNAIATMLGNAIGAGAVKRSDMMSEADSRFFWIFNITQEALSQIEGG